MIYQILKVLKTLKNYDGMRIPDYDNVCSEVAESDYLLSILKFLARRERVYTAIHGEIIGLKVSVFLLLDGFSITRFIY
jgi:hypothetical protein